MLTGRNPEPLHLTTTTYVFTTIFCSIEWGEKEDLKYPRQSTLPYPVEGWTFPSFNFRESRTLEGTQPAIQAKTSTKKKVFFFFFFSSPSNKSNISEMRAQKWGREKTLHIASKAFSLWCYCFTHEISQLSSSSFPNHHII